MPWRVGGGKWLKRATRMLRSKPRRGLTHGSPYVGVKSRPKPQPKPRVEQVTVYRHPHGYQRPVGFYKDKSGKTRPITRPLPSTVRYVPSPPPPIRHPVQSRVSTPMIVRPVAATAKPKTTLENPMLYQNFMKNLRAKVDPDSWDKVDWEGEVDKSLEVAEAENRLRLKYPNAFKEVESHPTKTEIKEMIVRREAEEKRVEEDLESAKKHGQIMTPEEERMQRAQVERREGGTWTEGSGDAGGQTNRYVDKMGQVKQKAVDEAKTMLETEMRKADPKFSGGARYSTINVQTSRVGSERITVEIFDKRDEQVGRVTIGLRDYDREGMLKVDGLANLPYNTQSAISTAFNNTFGEDRWREW